MGSFRTQHHFDVCAAINLNFSFHFQLQTSKYNCACMCHLVAVCLLLPRVLIKKLDCISHRVAVYLYRYYMLIIIYRCECILSQLKHIRARAHTQNAHGFHSANGDVSSVSCAHLLLNSFAHYFLLLSINSIQLPLNFPIKFNQMVQHLRVGFLSFFPARSLCCTCFVCRVREKNPCDCYCCCSALSWSVTTQEEVRCLPICTICARDFFLFLPNVHNKHMRRYLTIQTHIQFPSQKWIP